jgi:gamma-glutamylcyclotransferase (GGCT)/AIG2-like uncharacterized protein YtfP
MNQIRTPYIFVYGTLRPAHHSSAARALHKISTFVGPSKLFGTMHRLGWYPAVVLHKRGRPIFGDVVKLKNHTKVISFLDRYEGAYAYGDDYRRETVPVKCNSRAIIAAQVYVAKASVHHFPLIKSGNFPLARRLSSPH